MAKTKNTITLKGNPLNLAGSLPKVGDTAPDFEVLANDLSAVKLSDVKGKRLVICSVPSLDTPVCDTEVQVQ